MCVYLSNTNEIKIGIMKTQMEITANEIATRLVQGINRWNQQGAELKQRLLCLLEVEISFLSFENEVSKQMFLNPFFSLGIRFFAFLAKFIPSRFKYGKF